MPINIDEDEIRKFEAQTPQWWDKTGEFKGLHDINPLRLNYIDERSPLAEKSVLDVGCGGGILAEGMAEIGARVTGIDAGEAPLTVASRHALDSGLDIVYRRTTAEELAETETGVFDVVTCMELLEHVPNPLSVVKACGRLVQPGGDVFFATLNRNWVSFLLAIIAAEYVLGIVKKGTHTYRKFIKPSELDRWAAESGLVLRNLTGLQYNPVLKKKRLSGKATVNYLMHFSKIGDRSIPPMNAEV
jgi:2-polyprenyl-6-hydroxyphenyl methylase/3-demethylubiquinone-9 3-methyltransferase